MSVVVWDGKTLAADRRATNRGQVFTSTKFHVHHSPGGDEAVAYVGTAAEGLMMLKWYREGADVLRWPKFQDTDAWIVLIVATKHGAFYYENQPVPIPVECQYQAWGSGRDYAIGALDMGACAVRAVEAACKHDAGCGNGIDLLRVR